MEKRIAEVGLLVTPENINAWERVLPSLTGTDREQLGALLADMKLRSRWLREHVPASLARSA